MASERGRVISIFLAVAVIAGGGGFYFVKIYRPKQVKQDAQDEIVAWEARFKAARDCLLGPKPGSAKTSEALAIREMTPDPWERGKCTPLISKLTRGEAPDSGLPAVEGAWGELDHAASKAALAFAEHVDSSTTQKVDPLPAALDALDAARAKLRTAADLPATEGGGAALTQAAIVPISDGTTAFSELRFDSLPSAHGAVVFGKAGDSELQIMLAPGAKPQLARVSSTGLRSVSDPTWGATTAATQLVIGAMDADGAIAQGAPVKLENATVAAITGNAASGRIVYGTATQLFVSRSKDNTVTDDPAIKIIAGAATSDLDGRIAVLWQPTSAKPTDPPALWGRVVAPAGDEPAGELGKDMSLGATCFTKSRAHIKTGEQLIAFGGNLPPVHTEGLGFKVLVGCTADVALLRDMTPSKPLTVCDETCHDVAMPSGAPEYSATTVVNGKVVAVASHGGVLGVWREGAPVTFFGLPEDAKPVLTHEWPAMALTDGKTIDIIARGATKGFVIIRIPAN